jgi:hypothetical protein
MKTRRTRRSRILRRIVVAVVAAAVLLSGAIWADAVGAGQAWQKVLDRVDRFVAGPVPDRSIEPIVVVTPRPSPSPTPVPTPVPSGVTPATPAPTPMRLAMDVKIDRDPKAHFSHEIRDTWCSPAGVTMTLAVLGAGPRVGELDRQP